MLPCQPKFQSNQPKNLMQPFPLHGDAIHFFFGLVCGLTSQSTAMWSCGGSQFNLTLVHILSLVADNSPS